MKNHNQTGELAMGGSSKNQGNTLSGMKKGLPAALDDDSDDHDDFNPIKDLMPPCISGEDIDLIGKKRPRDKDPLRRLMVDSTSTNNPAATAINETEKDSSQATKR